VPTFGLTSGDAGAGVLDDVVPDEMSMKVITEPAELKFSEGNSTEVSPKSSADQAKVIHPPGYSAEVSSMTRILPGKELLFSVPLDHVSDAWFMRVRFVLDVNKPGVGAGPYTYLDFFKSQIPPSALPQTR